MMNLISDKNFCPFTKGKSDEYLFIRQTIVDEHLCLTMATHGTSQNIVIMNFVSALNSYTVKPVNKL